MVGRLLRQLADVGQNRYVGAAVAGSIAGLILLLVFLLVRGQRDTVVLNVLPVDDASVIHVYVGGDVASPGLLTLPRGSRLADAIDAAGGPLNSADVSALGMASVLQDADQIIVPSKMPTSAPTIQGGAGSQVPAPTQQPAQQVTATDSQTSPQSFPTTSPADVPININTATANELEVLPGVGPAIAQRIIEYRILHGPFQTLTELSSVSGISERMVEELAPMITLGS